MEKWITGDQAACEAHSLSVTNGPASAGGIVPAVFMVIVVVVIKTGVIGNLAGRF